MKKIYLLLVCFGMTQLSLAQQKETPLVTMGSMKAKISLNSATSIVTITLVGPSNKWISLGLNCTSMATNKDVITYGTTFLDQYFTSNGHVAPTTDITNNLTLVSNTVTGSTRTVVMTRPFSTGDAKDYTFAFTLNSLNVVWGVGPSTNITSEHSSFNNTTMSFSTVLGVEDFTLLKDITIAPNPSNGIFMIGKNNLTPINKIRVFDINAKLIQEINPDYKNESNSIDLTGLNSGLYFMEISNDNDQVVKKIIIN
jgi:hypothetical protein